MSDLNELLTGEAAEEEETQEAAQAEPEAPEEEAQEAKGDEPDDSAENGDAAEEAETDKPEMVPHARFHSELQKRKELEAELERMKQNQSPKVAPDLSHLFATESGERLPDPIDDAEGYQRAIEQRFNDRLYQQGFQVSDTAARRHYGSDTVDEALARFSEESKQNPLLQQAAKQSADPVGEIVGWYQQKRDIEVIQSAGGLDAYRKQIVEQLRGQTGQTPTETQPQAETTQQAMPTDMATTRNAAPRDGGFSPASLSDLL